ncbi:hypothetical protein GCM10020331_094960 [Ectobacillus funiculus]
MNGTGLFLQLWKKSQKELAVSPAQVAINWVRQQAGTVIPLIGAKREEQMKDNLGSMAFRLSETHLTQLNEASKIELGFPHDFSCI